MKKILLIVPLFFVVYTTAYAQEVTHFACTGGLVCSVLQGDNTQLAKERYDTILSLLSQQNYQLLSSHYGLEDTTITVTVFETMYAVDVHGAWMTFITSKDVKNNAAIIPQKTIFRKYLGGLPGQVIFEIEANLDEIIKTRKTNSFQKGSSRETLKQFLENGT